ncbi:TetR/AcrR family transcriptional regulator [Microbacterium sp. AK031]|uniref:TetR/AcrR family transcriptional regulator n=1 Tax=Microbacterium sp. AK031 TaxID=2723076 RepID=UPI00216A6159|nr:TetR/AcrR family transcriptional regulator [Microbacterium sp. AK031]MCS3841842.1 AcrR family transcriptional regulator [Microbacterium sp. AK031]
MPRATAADAAETARSILVAATAHFAEHGYASTSVDDIAKAADVTRGAVYHHYASKPRLFEAVASGLQLHVADAVESAAASSDPSVALRAGSHAFLDTITEARTVRILLVDAPAVLSWSTWRRMDDEGAAAHLRDALRAIGVQAELAVATAAALSGAMNELALWISERPSDASSRSQAHEALDALLDAVVPR